MRPTLQPSLEEARSLATQYGLIPLSLEFHCDTETPVSAFLKLKTKANSFLLESAEHGGRLGRYSFMGTDPRALLTLRGSTLTQTTAQGTDTLTFTDPFAAIADYLQAGQPAPLSGAPPFAGGAVGFFSYDLVRSIESIPDKNPDTLGLPELAFLITDTLVIFDHLNHTLRIVATLKTGEGPLEEAYASAARKIEAIRQKLAGPLPRYPKRQEAAPGEITSNFSRAYFEAAVERARDYIFAGDAFQVVPSQRFSTPLSCHPFSVYRALRAINPSPYMYYIHFEEFALVGSSPEPLVRVKDGEVELRPIAGTYPRGQNAEEDHAFEQELLSDEKERAEHLMLVDLGRNDIGRVCRPGSVCVAEYMTVERFSHVMHLVSSVTGKLRKGVTPTQALRAAFPAGTLTGAPKIRAMEIIDELEPVRRAAYGGAIGYLSYSGTLDTCITLRTMVAKDGVAHIQAGAGVVADSVASREYEETRNKAGALFKAIEVAHSHTEWE